ncbi:MGMT family protein [Denitrificimonas caeni]|uniref:MGMT family protein n=1 Tax=Denitrificimonas caeni TaxID=521720 RepID=A0AAF0AK26_9GAMM|nr:MGMT family protein [Denitrificimonas caeni]NLJ12059.1 DNA base-flipping protein YbaZ [Gammaproteobacteria bacterium]WBE25016.1 MGMT family protein [Denitrificimonas caeni]
MESENKQQMRIVLYMLLSKVPPGRLVTYGQLAKMAGYPGLARWVGRVLSQLPDDTQLPWHRVVAAGGRLSLPQNSRAGDEQRQRLRLEGIFVAQDRVKLADYQWQPNAVSE